MAKKCDGGPQCPYGYNHHDEHVRAAKLGWRRRRERIGWRRLTHGEAQYVEAAFGGKFELHSHPGGLFARPRYIMRDIESGEHFELSQSEYRGIVKEAQAQERARQRAATMTAKDEERERRRSARFEADELRRNLLEYVPRGIAPYRERNGKRPEQEEYQAVPRFFRARKGERLTLDDAALQLSESAPWLNIHSADDLTQAFNRITLRRMNERTRRKSA